MELVEGATPGSSSANGVGSVSAPPAEPAAPVIGALVQAEQEETFELRIGEPGDPGHFLARFTNRGAALLDLKMGGAYVNASITGELRDDPENWVPLLESFESGEEKTRSMLLVAGPSAQAASRRMLSEGLWQTQLLGDASAPYGIEFTLAPGSGVTFIKRFLFDATRHGFDLELELRNSEAGLAGPKQFILKPAAGMPANSGDTWWRGREPMAVAAGRESEGDDAEATMVRPGEKELSGPIKFPGELRFAGAANKYFALLVRDAEGDSTLSGASYRKLRDEEAARKDPDKAKHAWRPSPDVMLSLYMPDPGREVIYRYRVYAGPKDENLLKTVDEEFVALLDEDLGFFSPISHVLLWILRGIQSVTGNWGVAIILLTILVRSTLFPLNRRSQTTMARYQAKMKRLQPRIDEIKERNKNDQQKQRTEQAKLMQDEGLFPPLGGCLPMFLQLPVFFGLYRALGSAYELRQAPFFGWITDLSLPDRLLPLGLKLPFVGTIEYLNILPPIMVVAWILQQHGMPKPADEQAARMQKMMMWMPLMMGFFLYNYASGLSLYMITQSSLGVFEMKVIKKYWPVDDTEKPKKKKKSGFMARLMEQQQEQMKRMQEKQRKDKHRRGGGGGKGRPKKA
jgi:YidC/Oxa1 family membrane protein insertase